MTTGSAPPDFSLLSRFVDHELSPEEDRAVRAYLQEHPEAREQVLRIETATRRLTKALADASLVAPLQPRSLSSGCLPPVDIAAYLASSVSPLEKARMDGHLQTCDACLLEVVEARTIAAVLRPERLPPVPAHVQAQAEARWKPALSRIVLQLVQHGLKQVQHVLTAPILHFEVEPLSALARSSAPEFKQPLLTFRLEAEGALVRATAVAAQDGISLTMTWQGRQQEVLPGKRVQVQQEGVAVFSARTDTQGKIHVPYLSPGVYEIMCAELQVAFALELLFGPESTG